MLETGCSSTALKLGAVVADEKCVSTSRVSPELFSGALACTFVLFGGCLRPSRQHREGKYQEGQAQRFGHVCLHLFLRRERLWEHYTGLPLHFCNRETLSGKTGDLTILLNEGCLRNCENNFRFRASLLHPLDAHRYEQLVWAGSSTAHESCSHPKTKSGEQFASSGSCDGERPAVKVLGYPFLLQRQR